MPEGPPETTAETRKFAAIMFTDIVGFSRQMGSNEARTLRLLTTHDQIIQQTVAQHHGTVIKTVGDAFLVDFPSVVHAVQCAQSIQAQLRTHNAEKENAEQIHVRIGIHLGDIIQRDGDVFGDGVNIGEKGEKMIRTLAAIYQGGLFRPLEPVELPEHIKVQLTVETEEEAEARAQAILELARQSYAGLSEEEMAAVEAARLDTTRFFTSREPVL
ncbi:MAG TPA: adenylate/guanylate cyclase domain-containing protein [Candidatus Binatia bacterium]|nr:adenylate/guanylate cyclase domain-containing protein [Candidatus Binatia bacterium]